MATEFDAIVIGSGLGGLSSAATLSRLGKKKVLVLEKHVVPGGYTHVFTRPGGFEWDVGFHYTGQMGPGQKMRRFSDFVTQGRLDWHHIEDPHDIYIYPDERFEIQGDRELYRSMLKSRFPKESVNIDIYLKDIQKLENWSYLKLAEDMFAGVMGKSLRLMANPLRDLAEITTSKYLEKRFDDPKLRSLVDSNFCAYGLPSSQSAFFYHAMVANHYFEGAYYPVGGASSIAKSIIPTIEEHGGAVRLGAEVTKIVIEGGRAIGVDAIAKGQSVRYAAPIIISDAGLTNTYEKLLIGNGLCLPNVRHLLPGYGIYVLYMALKTPPERLGFTGANTIILGDLDHDRTFFESGVLEGRPQGGFLSFPCLKTPGDKAPTAEIFWFGPVCAVDEWKGTPWRKRGDSYKALKEKIAHGFLGLLEEHYPGFMEHVRAYEVSTPLTFNHFANHPNGSPYGLAMSPERLKSRDLGILTSVPGLYVTGADTLMDGIAPAFATGVMAGARALGMRGLAQIGWALAKNRR